MIKTRLLTDTLKLKGLLLLIVLFYSQPLHSQNRCPVPEILKERELKNPNLNTENFEDWIQKRINQTTNSASKGLQTVQIPVVFHIIHKGEPVGTGTNLLKSRVDRQLEIMNEDFNRQNADAIETLAVFQEVAAEFEIEFIYAKQNPDGFETSGIVRVMGSKNSYSYQERELLSAESYWPAEEYLNIWVADLAGGSLGWAEFPVSNLPGLDEASNNRLLDGVSLDYVYFGDNPDSPGFESRGRTATHELGHFFGLRHIWGDGGCSLDDFCEDTPSANSSSTGCNLNKTTCNSLDMVQNFMDYTNDACMNIFTLDQKSRVRTVVENSPRRKSLTTSKGLEEPPVFNRDLGLITINELYNGSCNGNFSPRVTVKNQGLFTADGYEVSLLVNGEVQETIISNTSISSGEQEEVLFSLLNFNDFGEYVITYQVELTGSFTDERLENNTSNEFFQLLNIANVPYKKSFSSGFGQWKIRNDDGLESWEIINGSAAVPFFTNPQNLGEQEALLSPIFDFTTIDIPEVNFVFAQSADSIPNKLSIYASYDCGRTFNDLIFSSSLTDLTTAYSVDSAFAPSFRLDWDTIKIDLNRLRNENSVCFGIVAENRQSNNFYISEFSIVESDRPTKQISPVEWIDVNPLFCEELISAKLLVRNTGRSNVNSFNLRVLKDNILIKEYLYNDATLLAGQSQVLDIQISTIDLFSGNFEIQTVVDNDQEEIIGKIFLPFLKNCEEELPPLRLSIREGETNNWFKFNPDKNQGWTYRADLNAAVSNSDKIATSQTSDWLISPLLDVSRTDYLGLIFDIAYQKSYRQEEGFEIYISDHNNTNFNTLIYAKKGDSLATSFGNSEDNEPIWRNEFVDLSPFVFREKIRLAFKVRHDNGQNVLLRNITFFVGQNPPPIFPETNRELIIYPNPAKNHINLHFNLSIADAGFFQIIDLNGKVLLSFNEPKILNQFISFDVSSLADGMYILRFQTKGMLATERFIIKR